MTNVRVRCSCKNIELVITIYRYFSIRSSTHLVVLVGQHVQQKANQSLWKFKFKCPEDELLQQRSMHKFIAQRWQITILIGGFRIWETIDGIFVFLAIRFEKTSVACILAWYLHEIRIDIGVYQCSGHHLAHYFTHIIQID